MRDHMHHVICEYFGLIPDGYEIYHSYPEAMARWEDIARDWNFAVGGDDEPFDPDEHRYVTDGHNREARFQQGGDVTKHDLLAVAVRRKLLETGSPSSVRVDVDEWVGCDEPWGDPVYVTAEDDFQGEYIDAICDLDADTLDKQVEFITEQLRHG